VYQTENRIIPAIQLTQKLDVSKIFFWWGKLKGSYDAISCFPFS